MTDQEISDFLYFVRRMKDVNRTGRFSELEAVRNRIDQLLEQKKTTYRTLTQVHFNLSFFNNSYEPVVS